MTLIGSIVVPVTNEGGPLLDLGGPDMSHSWKLPALAAVTSTQPVIADGTLEVGESVVTAPDNGYTFTKVMATGTVFSPSGEALQGAVVNVYAEPGMDVLRGLKEGDTYQRSLVGAAVSDQSGRYSIEPDYAALADASDPTEKGQSAPINVTFVVTSPGALTAYGATIWYSPGENVAAMASLETSGGARVADSWALVSTSTSRRLWERHRVKTQWLPASQATAASSRTTGLGASTSARPRPRSRVASHTTGSTPAVRTRPWEWATHSPGTRARGVSREQVSRHPVPQRTFLRAVPQGRT